MLDLVDDGSTWDEVEQLAKAIEKAGATIINTGIGWHEARVPTIATMVPRGGFSWVTKRLMGKVNIPLITTNRINMPGVAEKILADGLCTCLVNPRACFETELNYTPTKNAKKIAVVGAGPAGLSAATIAAQRGHQVHLYEAGNEIGGQFNMATMMK